MAIMIPDVIPFPDERSKEPDLFDQFKENLSDDYYVFHSLKFYGEEVGKKRDYEADFVILHPNYGLLCIECKSSYGGCLNGVCEYSDGTPMSDPYNQARTNKYALMKVIADRIDHDSSRALSSFKQNNNNNTIGFYHAVWFGMTKKHFEVARLNYPINGSAEITLFFDETADPKTAEARIEKLFKYSKEQLSDSQKRRMTRLTPDVVHALIGRILCPTFNIAYLPPSERSSNRFARLLRDQMTVLDFLDDQNVTVISGPAGSGKTFIAVEKARRLGAAGDKVLFLCFNVLLKEHLKNTYTPENGYDNICFDNIDNFVNERVGYKKYAEFYNWLIQADDFEYSHVIIDEAQDFTDIEKILKEDKTLQKASILYAFYELVYMRNGCFYLFYDKSQLVQSFGHLPWFINNAECKISLKRNCRNTVEITECLEKTGTVRYKDKDRQPVSHDRPLLFFDSSPQTVCARVRKLISQYRSHFSSDSIVILTMKARKDLEPGGNSCLVDLIVDKKFENIPVYTFREFKGLEKDCIIIVDMDYDYFTRKSKEYNPKRFKKEFYVATSRARSHLYIVSDLTQSQCAELLATKLEFDGEIEAEKVFEQFACTLGVDLS